MKEEVRLAKARVGAFARTSTDRADVATGIGRSETRGALKVVVKPPSISGAMRNAGAVLLITPDPFTGVPGAALLGASYVMKNREAANLASLAKETARTVGMIRDLKSLL